MGLGQFVRSVVDPVGSYRRQVAGTPKGGQFAPGYHEEVVLDLTLREQDQNAEGTWENPAYPSSAAALIDFWMNVPVPEYVVDHVMRNAPVVDHSGTARMVARCEMMRREMARLNEDVRTAVVRNPIPFPDGRVFNVYDALKFYGVNANAQLLPGPVTN